MDKCNDDVFKNGHSIATLDACMHRAEVFVQAVGKQSGQAVDWHYSGGRANVLYLGDFWKVAEAFKAREPMLAAEMPRKRNECGSCPSPDRHRPGLVLQRFTVDTHGPYRTGDPLPDDVIAVIP